MAAKGEVDFIIRAKNEATKNLDQINKSLAALADKQTIVGDSAAKTDDQLGRLGLELAKLQTNAKNLQALSTVGAVLDRATAAMERQREAAREAAEEQTRLATRQQALGAESSDMASSLRAATAELKKQDAALKEARTSLTGLGKETTSLTGQEKALQSSLATAAAQLAKRQTALDAAVQKQAQLTAAIANSDKVTKVQQNSLDAANRALERRQAAVAETVAREADLQQKLSQVRTALNGNAAATEKANAALAEQVTRTTEAKTAVAGLKVQADSLAKAERDIVKEVKSASASVEQQAAALQEAETEYSQVQAAATAAKTAIAGTATSTKNAGEEAGRAAVQVATFAARLAVLAGAGTGKTSNPLNINPAEIRDAEGALSELGTTIRAADSEATRASVSAKEMTAALKGVGEAQATLQGIGQAITSQKASVDGAKQAWKSAEAEVRRLALAIREADQPSEELAAALGKAQGAARLAKDEFIRQTDAAGKIAGALKQAGVGAGDLASAEAALVPRIQRANDLMNQGRGAAAAMGGALAKAGADADSASPKVNRLANVLGLLITAANRGAAATNPLRLLKNELVALAATAGGLYALKEQLVSVWEAGTNLEANKMKFATAFDGVEEGARELEYAREVALNLKLPIDGLTKSYADLALAAKGTSLEGAGARDVFEAFAQTARVNGASAESLEGTYKALTQIMSKGKVQAEELRGQLGDRLPGAMQLMAEGLGVSTEKLDSMMEKGELTREALLGMAAAASQRVAPQLAAALDSPAAKLADFQNRIMVFKETVAGSGFLDAVADAFDKMATALSSPEAIQGARDLGQAMADLVMWLVNATEHMDAIVATITALGVAWVALQIGSMISGLYGFIVAIGATTIAVLGLDVALSPILVGLGALAAIVGVVAAAFGSWKLAVWAYENVPAFAEGVLKIKNAALVAWDGILQFWEMTSVKLKNSFTRVCAQLANTWYGMLNSILGAFPDLTKALGMGDYAADIRARAAAASAALTRNEQNLNAALDQIRSRYATREGQRQRELQNDIAGYYRDRRAAEQAVADADKPAPAVTPPPRSPVGLRTITAAPYTPSTARADETAATKAANERVALEQQVANQMFTIRAQLEQKSAQTLDAQIAAVPAKYAKLYEQLTTLGKDRNSEEWQTVDALVAQEQANIRTKAAQEAATKAAREEREAAAAEEESRKAAMEHVNTLLQTRKNIQEQLKRAEESGDVVAAETLKENLATITQQATDAIAGMLAFWQAVGGPEADAAIAKLETMKLALTKVKDEGILTGENIAKTFGQQLSNAGDDFVDRMAETGDVFESLGEAFRSFAISFLKDIAKMIIQQMIFNALKAASNSNPYLAVAGAAVGAATNHTGGVVGRDSGPRRTLPAAMFQNAVRYHGGGIAGLRSNEVPTVLEAGEVVRTQQQEKALAERMDASAGGGGASPQIKIVNQIDSGDMVSAGLGSTAGEKAFINSISQNRDTIKRILG